MIKIFYILSIYISILGYSAIVTKIFFKNYNENVNSFDLVFGLILLYFLSFLINFFFPLKYFSTYIFGVGLILFLFFFKYAYKNIDFYLIFIIVSLTIIIEPNSLAADTNFYHLQIIKWYSNERAVFGVANLESRLGLISGWHHLLSMFNIVINKVNFLYILNTIPLIIISHQVFTNKSKNYLKLNEIYLNSVLIFLLIFAIIHPTLNGTIFNAMGSADADSAGTYFFIGSFYFFLKFIDEKKEKDFLYLITLVNLSYIAKISNIFLILLPLYLIIFNNIDLKKMKNFIIFLFILNIFWLSKIVISTGCLIFPLEFTCFNFDWSVPKHIVNSFILEASAFPRSKNNVDVHYHNLEYYIYSYKWFHTWFMNYFINISFIQICFLLIIISLLLIIRKISFDIFLFNKKILVFLFIFFLIKINYWLIAPDIRYAYGIFISVTLLFFSYAVNNNTKYIDRFIKYKNIIFMSLFIILVIKNIKYQFSDNFFNKNRTFDYTNISFYKKINNFELYKTSSGNCAFFEKICINSDKESLIIERNHNYLFIKNEK